MDDTRTNDEKRLDYALSVLLRGGELPYEPWIDDEIWVLWGITPSPYQELPLDELYEAVRMFVRGLLVKLLDSKSAAQS